MERSERVRRKISDTFPLHAETLEDFESRIDPILPVKIRPQTHHILANQLSTHLPTPYPQPIGIKQIILFDGRTYSGKKIRHTKVISRQYYNDSEPIDFDENNEYLNQQATIAAEEFFHPEARAEVILEIEQ